MFYCNSPEMPKYMYRRVICVLKKTQIYVFTFWSTHTLHTVSYFHIVVFKVHKHSTRVIFSFWIIHFGIAVRPLKPLITIISGQLTIHLKRNSVPVILLSQNSLNRVKIKYLALPRHMIQQYLFHFMKTNTN